ncbi:MAG: FAD-dependent oxidoreductase [Actinobacteria bacterium]|nr:FAD-dependent oxidoreductase [Actinomycetota bacterium]
MENYVIIGNSGAAISAVRAIRSINTKDKITIISKENYPAYSPVSITYYLNDSISYEQLFFCDEKFYKLNKINTFLGIECVCIDTKNKKVVLENGNLVKYDKLLISTGASPIVPKIKNISFDDILTARTIIDAEKIKYTIFNSKKIVIIGAGLAV